MHIYSVHNYWEAITAAVTGKAFWTWMELNWAELNRSHYYKISSLVVLYHFFCETEALNPSVFLLFHASGVITYLRHAYVQYAQLLGTKTCLRPFRHACKGNGPDVVCSEGWFYKRKGILNFKWDWINLTREKCSSEFFFLFFPFWYLFFICRSMMYLGEHSLPVIAFSPVITWMWSNPS